MKKYIKSNQDDKYLKANTLANEVEMLFDNNQINAEFLDVKLFDHSIFPRVNIYFRITGDWKHDHLFADNLVQEQFGPKVSITSTDEEDTGDDWYSATHIYTIVL